MFHYVIVPIPYVLTGSITRSDITYQQRTYAHLKNLTASLYRSYAPRP